MEWRRDFLALMGPSSLGQELEVGKAQSPQVAESFCLHGISPCFLPPFCPLRLYIPFHRGSHIPSPKGKGSRPIPFFFF